ncbi:hypothetical protein QUF74_04920 [Candidatus Halobeggiatoa sp. HSG11]|nr:hypothetical protein [Candidatus Halobeggiatoa sp. HSG11]
MTDKTTFNELVGKNKQREAVKKAMQNMQEKQLKDEEKRYKSLAYPLVYLNKYMTELANLLNSLGEEIEIPEACLKNPNNLLKCLTDELPDIAKLDDGISPIELLNWLKKGIQLPIKYQLFHEKIVGNLTNNKIEKSVDFDKRHDFSLTLECVPEKRSDVKLTFFDFRSIDQKLTDKEKFLRNHNLDFTASEVKCENGQDVKAELQVENKVDIKFQFNGNEKTGLIDLEIQNFGGMGKNGEFGFIKLEIAPILVNARLIEALALFVLRRPSELFGIAEVVKDEFTKQPTKQYVPKKSQFKKVNLMKVLKNINEETQKTSKVVKNTQKEIEKIKTRQKKTQKTVEEIHIDQKKHTALVVGWMTSLLSKQDSRSR